MAESEPPRPDEALSFCVSALWRHLQDDVAGALEARGLRPPAQIGRALAGLDEVEAALGAWVAPSELEPHLMALAAAAIRAGRRAWARQLEVRAEVAHHPALLEALDAEREVLDAVMREPWFTGCAPAPIPRLADFLSLEAVEQARREEAPPWLPRAFDDTFHQLCAARLFEPDLDHPRDACDRRGRPLAVATMDLDDLRPINAAHGARRVDRALLPVFLRALEAHVYGRGHAYGFGRDDFALILPGADEASAVALLHGFQARLTGLDYHGIPARPTVSIGLAVLAPGCPLTNLEVSARAERGERAAKAAGKDAVGIARGEGEVILRRGG